MADTQQALENLLSEERVFAPADDFVAHANGDKGIYDRAESDWQGFWRKQALERITWFKEPTITLDDSNPPFYKWFPDGELNLAYNCLDRHLESQATRLPISSSGNRAMPAPSPTGISTSRLAAWPTA